MSCVVHVCPYLRPRLYALSKTYSYNQLSDPIASVHHNLCFGTYQNCPKRQKVGAWYLCDGACMAGLEHEINTVLKIYREEKTLT